MYLCECKDNVKRFNLCKHIYSAASQLNRRNSSDINNNKEKEISGEIKEIFSTADPPPVNNNKHLSDQILAKANKITELSRAKLIPIENTKIDDLLRKVLLKMCPKSYSTLTGDRSSATNRAKLTTDTSFGGTLKAARLKKLEKQKCFTLLKL